MLGRYIQSVFGAVLPRYDSVAILKDTPGISLYASLTQSIF